MLRDQLLIDLTTDTPFLRHLLRGARTSMPEVLFYIQ